MIRPSTIGGARQAGFTLLEIMIVMVIIGIIAGLIGANIFGRPDEARMMAAQTDIRSIKAALELYRLDNGHYPSTEQGLGALVTKPSGYPEPKKWSIDGYLQKIPTDPWDEPYLYFSEGRKIEVYTFGADRKEGGEGVDADIYLSNL